MCGGGEAYKLNLLRLGEGQSTWLGLGLRMVLIRFNKGGEKSK